MNLATTLDRLHAQARLNRWLRYFAVFCRVALAAGFLPSGFVKIMGERFTSLSDNQPMGHYLEALSHTGYYYTYIGIAQMTAAVLLLIPGTAVLGAVLYFPIILNICILSLAVRFEGSLLTSPLMVVANVYLLCWYYDRLKHLLPFNQPTVALPAPASSNEFPKAFFAGAAATVALVVLTVTNVFDVMPRNTLADCRSQFKGRLGHRTTAGKAFCECIHQKGQPLDQALDAYHQAPDDARQTPPAVGQRL
ncbi:DoxX family protein [Hymenobacter sp. BT523]|uniref:DoxX family protein n=1 Tax=Hymenobacter sp. BT523 TaxID=2795725 RepID=UPI0018EDEE4A|nr:DoxX family protein [Hymenobacter sp. BT523]MBJ6111030.1 DoxX family protein [Hymenobacter sp. BT523]